MKEEPGSIVEAFEIVYAHRVYFTRDVFSRENTLLASILREITRADVPRVLMVADGAFIEANPDAAAAMEAFFAFHRDGIDYSGCLELPGGEVLKNEARYLERLYKAINTEKLCRHSCVVALGGGALLDLVGFAAATAHRGVRHLRLPTTSLSQGDGGCGVKNSVNYLGKKNFLGTFTPPDAVINDITFLESLPDARWVDGIIEAIKVALIKDRSFFDYLEDRVEALLEREPTAVRHVMETSARHHVHHIVRSGDPFELTSSRPLDFGHWSAHKLEVLTDFALSHGECVAIGIALDICYSFRKGYLSESEFHRILDVIERFGFRLFDERLASRGADGQLEVLRGLEEFREHLGGELTIPLLRGIGDPFEVHEIDDFLIEECIERLGARESNLAA